MATNNQINLGLSGVTGTGNYAGSTSQPFTTPTLGAASATSLVFSPTTGGIVGVTTNNDAAAGVVGEFLSGTATGIALTSTVTSNVCSVSLTAGDWQVSGSVAFAVAGGASCTYQSIGLSSTSATLGTLGAENNTFAEISDVPNLAGFIYNVGVMRFNLSSTTTVYLVANCTFGGTLTADGYISARRVR